MSKSNAIKLENDTKPMRQNYSFRHSIVKFTRNLFCKKNIEQLMKSLSSSHETNTSFNGYYIIADYSKTSATVPLNTRTELA